MNASTNSSARPRIHVCVIQPAGYVHSMGLVDPARYVHHQMQRLGIEASIAKNRLMFDAVNIVFGAHLGFDPALRQRYCCLFVNLEQLGEGGAAVAPDYLRLLRSSAVADYEPANVATYAAPGTELDDVPIISFLDAPYVRDDGAAPPLPLAERPIDVLFYGSMNDRRRGLIEAVEAAGVGVTSFRCPVYGPERDAVIRQAKLVLNLHHYEASRFEQVRAFQVLSLGTPMLCERNPGTRPPAAFEDAVFWSSPEQLTEFFRTEFRTPAFYARAQAQLDAFAATDPVLAYADLVGFASGLWQVHLQRRPAKAWQPTQINIGSGKDYKLGWFNLDVVSRAQPDAMLDLGQPLALPFEVNSRFVGPVRLAPASVDTLYANNVLEHVPDLVTFMTQALALLKTGGEFKLEVPYEHSPGAWQDPTHVRAMNDKSWLYYTDWFWYLGWVEHRFRIDQFDYLDLALAPCAQAAAHFMRLRLVKVETTVPERMKARTMQPDFGGLFPPIDPHEGLEWTVREVWDPVAEPALGVPTEPAPGLPATLEMATGRV